MSSTQDNSLTTRNMSGGEAIARIIKAFNGGPMFGMGGFQVLPLYEAARQLGLTHHLIHDERNAIFLADAYAKITGPLAWARAVWHCWPNCQTMNAVRSLHATRRCWPTTPTSQHRN